MEELRPPGSRVDLRSEPVLGRSASETSSTGTRSEEEVGFSAIGSGGADRLHDRVAMPGSSGSARKEIADESRGISQHSGRWPVNFLPGSWCEECQDSSPAPRASIVVAYVPTAFRAAIGPLPLDCAGL